MGCVTFSLDLEYLVDISVKIHFLCAAVNLLLAKNISITLVYYIRVHLIALELRLMLKTFHLFY